MEDKKVPTRINAELIYYQLAEIKSENASFRAEFKDELADLKRRYVTQEQSTSQFNNLRYEIEELRNDIKELKKSRTLIGWIYPTATAILTAVLTFIVVEFLRNRNG